MAAKLIAFSGAHSTGKTSTLDAIKAANIFDIYVDDFKASRQAQAELGMELSDIIADPKLMREFQTRILYSKWEHEKELIKSREGIILVDRSPADIYAYTYMWNEQHPNLTWFEPYELRLTVMIQEYAFIVDFPIIDEVPFVEESGRATLETRARHSRLTTGFLKLRAPNSHHRLSAVSIDERVTEIVTLANILQVAA
jgi:thymidylate kinase